MRIKINLTILAVLLAFSSASAQWIEKSSMTEKSAASGALQHRHIEVEKASGDTAEIDLALFSTKSNLALRVVDNANGSSALAEAMESGGLLAGVNGGYFDPKFAPLGLRVVDGKVVRPLLHARLMTGLLLSAPGTAQILRVGEYSARRKVTAALQCGPLLVDGGRPVAGLDRTRRARRTFAVAGPDHFALGVCSETSLADAAEILATVRIFAEGKVARALNLDGGSSSAFWFKHVDGSAFSISEMKSVRDFVGIAPR